MLIVRNTGVDTVGATLTQLLCFILADPTVYTNLRNELDQAYPQGYERINVRELTNLSYLSAVVEECFRIGSTFHGVPREVGEQGKIIDGSFVPPGTTVSVTSFVLHMSEEQFSPHPERFMPERWPPLGYPSTSKRHCSPSSLLTFSAGESHLHILAPFRGSDAK